MDSQTLRKGYTGYELTDKGRSDLLVHIEPRHPDVIAHHVTHEFGVYEQLPPSTSHVRVIAEVYDDKVQAVVVMVAGTTGRPDGGTYHITVSLDKSAGAKPVDSNKIIESEDWNDVDNFNIDVEPKFFSF